jgi:phosphate transport system permease protein
MPLPLLFSVLVAMSAGAYALGLRRSLRVAGGGASHGLRHLHSLPEYHGLSVALWCGIPSVTVALLWSGLQGSLVRRLVTAALPPSLQSLPEARLSLLFSEIENVAAGLSSGSGNPAVAAAAAHLGNLRETGTLAMVVCALSLGLVGAGAAHRRIRVGFRARNEVERVFKVVLILCSSVAVVTTVGIVLSVLFEALRFFQTVPVTDFLFGLEWSPQTAIRADQVGASGSFGAVPLLAGTLLISTIALCVGAPIGLLSAIYLAEYATPRQRALAKPALEILAGIPTVVYGFFAALTVAPFLRDVGESAGLSVSSESALAAGLVMGIMLVPFVSSLSDDVISAVPQSLREGSYGLGATRSETIRNVVLPAALPGVVGALLLAVSRAIGETMIVVMAAGLTAKLTGNPFEAVTTVTVQIVTLLVGDQEFDSPKTLAAFALGLTLFVVTLTLNVYALRIVRKYREQYD